MAMAMQRVSIYISFFVILMEPVHCGSFGARINIAKSDSNCTLFFVLIFISANSLSCHSGLAPHVSAHAAAAALFCDTIFLLTILFIFQSI